MFSVKRFGKAAGASFLMCLAVFSVFSQNKEDDSNIKRVMWEPVTIGERDLYLGPGGQQMQPDLKRALYLGRQEGGNSIKHRIKDASGREWIAKIGRETQPETAAVRLLWGIGYKTEVNYLVPKMSISTLGNYKNVRLEARPENVKRQGSWSWVDNPFKDTNELEGLKIMMAMLNNWDIKDENTAILKDGDEHHYIISDLGASFGKLADETNSRSGRSVNKPEDFARSKFIRQVSDGIVEVDYRGKQDYFMKGFKVEHGRWLADLLLQLSDKQIDDAFRAANYKPEEIRILTQAFKARIKELDAATKPASNTANLD